MTWDFVFTLRFSIFFLTSLQLFKNKGHRCNNNTPPCKSLWLKRICFQATGFLCKYSNGRRMEERRMFLSWPRWQDWSLVAVPELESGIKGIGGVTFPKVSCVSGSAQLLRLRGGGGMPQLTQDSDLPAPDAVFSQITPGTKRLLWPF